ncbi:hypothetical protein, partial [Cellulomonas algicola]
AIPVFLNQRKKAVDASIKSDLRTVANELETFYTDWQQYPSGGIAANTASQTNNKITIAANSAGATSNAAIDIKLSPGNVVSVVVDSTSQTYAISGFNEKGTANTSATKVFNYTSNGGLVPGAPGAAASAPTP